MIYASIEYLIENGYAHFSANSMEIDSLSDCCVVDKSIQLRDADMLRFFVFYPLIDCTGSTLISILLRDKSS